MSTLTDFIPWLLDSGGGCCGISYDAVLFNRVEDQTDITISGATFASPTMVGSSFSVTFPQQGLFDIAAIQYRFVTSGSVDPLVGIGIKIGDAYIPAPVLQKDTSSACWLYLMPNGTRSTFAGFSDDIGNQYLSLAKRVFCFDIAGLGIGGQSLTCQFFMWCSNSTSPVLKGSTLKTILGYRVGSLA
ncbi:MAG: hypothetical protein HY985_11260 [Magnetospirillum sp.]|nr:hypothetical protein [Magnetospirillum sp.]